MMSWINLTQRHSSTIRIAKEEYRRGESGRPDQEEEKGDK